MATSPGMQAVVEVLDRYFNAYQRRSIEEIAGVVACDATLMAYGTDEGEVWHGWDDYRLATETFFRVVQELHWNRTTPRVAFSRDGNVAWFSEDVTGYFVSGGGRHECSFRMSGVLERRDGNWTIVQFHRAVPVNEYAVPYLDAHGVRFD
jgi:ketosteroid isomerase-like protein